MNLIDWGLTILIVICMILGYRRGVIKGGVRLVGLVVIGIVSYSLSKYLAAFLIKHLNFFNFQGELLGLYSLNILLYNAIAFLFIFLMLYSILNILISIAGLFDKVVKATIILAIPNKLLGAVIGFFEALIIIYIGMIVLAQIPQTHVYTLESKVGSNILNRTPVIRTVGAATSNSVENIYLIIKDKDETPERKNIKIVNELIKYRIITAEQAQELVDKNKLGLDMVQFR